MEKLMVFDIQRAAVHDGPGVRTTVFLKGCPLRCIWCHNPESQSGQPQLKWVEKQCIHCRACEAVCPQSCHQFRDGIHSIDFKKCGACGRCTSVCITKALQIIGREMETDEIISVLLKDKVFYDKSGGGITVSGGEPMAQFAGLCRLLAGIKRHGLHICLDTSGYAPTENYEEILGFVDAFLYDYKLTDDSCSRYYLGVTQELIMENLDFLCRNQATVYLRCPMIPGINDTEEHLAAIARLSKRYSHIKEVHIMAYHDIARAKFAQIGCPAGRFIRESMTKEEKGQVVQRLRALGCSKINEDA